jgi:ketosteroid isomerase-like protein
MKPYLFTALTVGLISGAVPREQTQDSEGIHDLQRRYLLATDRFYSFLSGTLGIVDGFTAELDTSALYLHVGAPIIQGRDQIREFLQNTYPNPTFMTWRHASGDVSANGKLGYTWGWTELQIDGGTVQYGKYIAFWKLEHGLWKAVAYMRNPSPGPPPDPPDGFPLLSGGHGVPHPGNVEQGRQHLLEVDQQFSDFSVENGIAEAFPAYVDEIGVELPGGDHMVFGRDAIAAYYANVPRERVLSWTPTFVDVPRSGDIGFTAGPAVLEVPQPGGGVQRFYSKYLSVWARQSDGDWKFILDGGNASPAPP